MGFLDKLKFWKKAADELLPEIPQPGEEVIPTLVETAPAPPVVVVPVPPVVVYKQAPPVAVTGLSKSEIDAEILRLSKLIPHCATDNLKAKYQRQIDALTQSRVR